MHACRSTLEDPTALTLVGAAYSERLNRLVVATEEPAALLVVDPYAGSSEVHPLAFAPRAIALSPSGHVAVAVSADGRSAVWLALAGGEAFVATAGAPADSSLLVGFVAVSDDGVLLLSHDEEAPLGIWAAGDDPAEGPVVPARAQLTLSPAGDLLWAATTSSIHRYKMNAGASPELVDAMPIGGIVPCERHWLGEGGGLFALSCQQVYRLDDDGALQSPFVDEDGCSWLAWSYSAEHDVGVWVKDESPAFAALFDATTSVVLDGAMALPLDAAHVFFSASGAKLVVVGDDPPAVAWLSVLDS